MYSWDSGRFGWENPKRGNVVLLARDLRGRLGGES